MDRRISLPTWLMTTGTCLAVLAGTPAGASAQEDVTPPVVTGFSLSPATIDTSAGPATLTLTMQASDDLTGICAPPSLPPCGSFISPAQVRLQHSGSQQTKFGLFSLVAGTLDSGTFEAQVTFPQFSGAGTWDVASLMVADNVGNIRTYSGAALQALGFPFQFVNAATVDDLIAPALTDFVFAPATIDTSTGDAIVTVTMALTDDLSGVCVSMCTDLSSPTQVRFQNAQTGQIRDGLFTLVSGTPNAGTFEAQVAFNQDSAGGVWNVTGVLLADLIGNRAFLSKDTLAARGFSTQLINLAGGDVTPPALQSFSFSPTAIDTSAAPAIVTVTLGLTDDISGVCLSICDDHSSPTQVRFEHVATGQIHFGLFTLVAGTLNNGTFEAQITFPRFSAAGPWRVTQILLVDIVGNRGSLSDADLAALGFPTDVTVAESTLDVVIDIKPGGLPNSINTRSQGMIPVAVISTPSFDVSARLDAASLTFGRSGDEPSLAFCNPPADVNSDGLLDRVCHFTTALAAFQPGDVVGVLKGSTVDGVPIVGSDSVRIVR